jgi:hypothetical protein
MNWTAILPTREIKADSRSLEVFASAYITDQDLRSRIAEKFWFDVLVHYLEFGIDPKEIVDAIENLEAGEPHNGVKPATEFTRHPLKGLWHKHYFTARFLPANISLALRKDGLKDTIESILDPVKYPVITPEAIEELAHAVVSLPVEKRDADGKITGEWIIFAKHEGKNYYLSMAIHTTADQVIYDNIMKYSAKTFPDLKSWLPA